MTVALFGWTNNVAYGDGFGFTIPNHGSAANPALERWTETAHRIINVMRPRGEGVRYGCRVTGQVSPNYTISITSGSIRIRGADATLAACLAIPTPADSTKPRIDLVAAEILSSGAAHVVIVPGSAASYPLPPAIGNGYVALAYLWVPPTCLAIQSSYIVDKRALLQPSTSVLSGHASDTVIGLGTTRYGGFVGRFTPGNTETDFGIVIPRAGTLSRLTVVQGTDGTVAAQVDVTLRINEADTALVTSVTVNAGTYTDTTHSVSVAAGDRIDLKLVEVTSSFDSGAMRGVSVLLDLA